jgi:hypothetical protein
MLMCDAVGGGGGGEGVYAGELLDWLSEAVE